MCEVHIAFSEDVDCGHILSCRKADLGNLPRPVPMVPLPPCDRIRIVERGSNRQRRSCRLSVHVEGDGPAAIGGVEKIRSLSPGLCSLHCDIEPLAGPDPSDKELVFRRTDHVIGIVVDCIMKLCVGDIDAFVHAKWLRYAPSAGLRAPLPLFFASESW